MRRARASSIVLLIGAMGVLATPSTAAPRLAATSMDAPAAGGCKDHWVAGWAASPSDASGTRPAVSNQTLRMIVTPHYEGFQLRLRLTNRFGTDPVTIDRVTVARQVAGAAIFA